MQSIQSKTELLEHLLRSCPRWRWLFLTQCFVVLVMMLLGTKIEDSDILTLIIQAIAVLGPVTAYSISIRPFSGAIRVWMQTSKFECSLFHGVGFQNSVHGRLIFWVFRHFINADRNGFRWVLLNIKQERWIVVFNIGFDIVELTRARGSAPFADANKLTRKKISIRCENEHDEQSDEVVAMNVPMSLVFSMTHTRNTPIGITTTGTVDE